jgi:hypothetical protein
LLRKLAFDQPRNPARRRTLRASASNHRVRG